MVALQILVLPVGVRILLGERKTPNTHRVRFFFRIGSLRLSVRTKDSQSLKTSSTLVGTENRFLIYCNTRNYKYRPKSCKQICKQFGRLFFIHAERFKTYKKKMYFRIIFSSNIHGCRNTVSKIRRHINPEKYRFHRNCITI